MALIFQQILQPETVWVFIPLTALFIPIVAITASFLTSRAKLKRDTIERAESRRLYEKIAMEKLDIIKTAISMGYKTDELAELDRRLEMLVGSEKMSELLAEPAPLGKSKSKSKGRSDFEPVKVKVSMTTIPDPPAVPRVPSPAGSPSRPDTTEELLLGSEDLMDRATLEALSKELEQRRRSKA